MPGLSGTVLVRGPAGATYQEVPQEKAKAAAVPCGEMQEEVQKGKKIKYDNCTSIPRYLNAFYIGDRSHPSQ